MADRKARLPVRKVIDWQSLLPNGNASLTLLVLFQNSAASPDEDTLTIANAGIANTNRSHAGNPSSGRQFTALKNVAIWCGRVLPSKEIKLRLL